MTAIEQLNDAKRKLSKLYPAVIQTVTIVLGDKGFRLEVTLDPAFKKTGAKWDQPKEVDGIPVVYS